MAGTTTNYALPYPTGSDLLRNGDNAIQSLAEAVENLLDTSFITRTEDTGSSITSTTSTSYANRTDCQVTFTTGASGVFQVILEVDLESTNTASAAVASVDITGALTQAATDTFSVKNQSLSLLRAGTSKFFVGTPKTSCTVTLAVRSSAGNNAIFNSARIQVVTFG